MTNSREYEPMVKLDRNNNQILYNFLCLSHMVVYVAVFIIVIIFNREYLLPCVGH